VTPISNYFFNVVSAIVLSLLAGLIIDRVVEPSLVRSGFPDTEVERDDDAKPATDSADDPTAEPVSATVTPAERSGLRAAGVALLLLTIAVLVLVLMPDSPLRNETGGYLPESPLLDSVVTLVFLAFFVPALFYGIVAGTIRRGADVPLLMGRALKDLSGFIVLAFILGQFIALFAWTNIGAWLAVSGATLLETIGLTGYPAILGFVVLASLLNLFIVSGSSLWTLMASVFVPLFLLLGYEPGFVQGAFRVGDAATQVMTPLNPYMIVLLTFVRRYQPNAGLGTVIAKMVPFVVPFWVAWVLVLTVFYAFDIPLGPGVDVRVGE
jgi:aminobenzoyl-glutamate transport protein